jgi:hypothetical protein
MSGYNQVKRGILEALDAVGEVTAGELATFLGRSDASTAMALLRYHRQGLVSGFTVAHNAKVYALTDRGYERLVYLRSTDDA